MKRFPFLFALVGLILVASIPMLGEWVKDLPRFSRLGRDVDVVSNTLQTALCWPWGEWITGKWLRIGLAFPWFYLLGLALRFLHRKALRGRYRFVFAGMLMVWILLRVFPGIIMFGESDAPSISKGSVANGSLENGKRVPYSGTNYRTYSFAGYLAGRTFVHEKVREAILEAYQILEKELPNQEFVLMETGRRFGGRFLPHRTHRNGLSVDFMTPLFKNGKSYVASGMFNGWGYGRNFDNQGKKGSFEIDYETMARHLRVLNSVAAKHGLAIQKVIFDPVLRPYLLKTPSGRRIQGLPYTRNRVAVRHDDHYHVDFRIVAP